MAPSLEARAEGARSTILPRVLLSAGVTWSVVRLGLGVLRIAAMMSRPFHKATSLRAWSAARRLLGLPRQWPARRRAHRLRLDPRFGPHFRAAVDPRLETFEFRIRRRLIGANILGCFGGRAPERLGFGDNITK